MFKLGCSRILHFTVIRTRLVTNNRRIHTYEYGREREVVLFYYQYVHFREVWEIVGSSIVWGREEGQYYLVWGGGVVGGADDVDLVILVG